MFLALFIVIVWLRLPLPAVIAGAISLGSTQFSFGALARPLDMAAAHPHRPGVLTPADARTLLSTAYALESAFDELLYIIGPIGDDAGHSVSPVSQLIVRSSPRSSGGAIFFSAKTDA